MQLPWGERYLILARINSASGRRDRDEEKRDEKGGGKEIDSNRTENPFTALTCQVVASLGAPVLGYYILPHLSPVFDTSKRSGTRLNPYI